MSVGNKYIEGAIIKRDSGRLLKAFKLFENAVDSHFRNESRIAKTINFAFAEYLLEHQYVLSELKTMKDGLVSNAGRGLKVRSNTIMVSWASGRRCISMRMTCG